MSYFQIDAAESSKPVEFHIWTPEAVIAELILAFEVLADTGGSIGPKGFASLWPEYKIESADLWEQMRSGSNTVGRMNVRRQYRASEISRAERVLYGTKLPNGREIKGWIAEFLNKQGGARRCLMAHVLGTIQADRHGRTFKASQWCRRHRVAESTFRSRRDRGAAIIAVKLNEARNSNWQLHK